MTVVAMADGATPEALASVVARVAPAGWEVHSRATGRGALATAAYSPPPIRWRSRPASTS